MKNDVEEVEALYRKGLAIATEVQDGRSIADATAGLGEFLSEQGRQVEGCRLLAEAAQFYHEQELPEEAEVRETIQRLGCEEA